MAITSWESEGLNWDDPDPSDYRYLDSIVACVQEKINALDMWYLQYFYMFLNKYTPLVQTSVKGDSMNVSYLNLVEEHVRNLIRYFINHVLIGDSGVVPYRQTAYGNQGFAFWDEPRIYKEAGFTSLFRILGNGGLTFHHKYVSGWLKQQYQILNMLRWSPIWADNRWTEAQEKNFSSSGPEFSLAEWDGFKSQVYNTPWTTKGGNYMLYSNSHGKSYYYVYNHYSWSAYTTERRLVVKNPCAVCPITIDVYTMGGGNNNAPNAGGAIGEYAAVDWYHPDPFWRRRHTFPDTTKGFRQVIALTGLDGESYVGQPWGFVGDGVNGGTLYVNQAVTLVAKYNFNFKNW